MSLPLMPKWREALLFMYVYTPDTIEGFRKREDAFRSHFPGNYKIVEGYDAKRGAFGLKLEFDSPQDETIFRLKHD